MNVETLIYAYLAICTSMIVFNCACIVVFRRRNAELKKRSDRLTEEILLQIQRLKSGDSAEERHKELLQKKLQWANNLMVFDETLERLLQKEEESVWNYVREISPVFTYLAVKNKYHDVIKVTYFAYVIKKYRIIEGKPVHVVLEVMMKLLQEPSLYCRENALQAIYSCGDCGCVLRALHEVDESGKFHHGKLLTDGLLRFSGDRKQLTDALWKAFDRFSVSMRVVILDYIRFSGGAMQEELLQLLADSRQDDEIRFSCIRYFGKYSYEPAFPILIALVENKENKRWEYPAIAATALAGYPCERSIEVLKRKLNSSNWYIRFNAAKSLERFRLSYLEVSDVMEGNDRYAREILQYQIDMEHVREEQEVVQV